MTSKKEITFNYGNDDHIKHANSGVVISRPQAEGGTDNKPTTENTEVPEADDNGGNKDVTYQSSKTIARTQSDKIISDGKGDDAVRTLEEEAGTPSDRALLVSPSRKRKLQVIITSAPMSLTERNEEIDRVANLTTSNNFHAASCSSSSSGCSSSTSSTSGDNSEEEEENNDFVSVNMETKSSKQRHSLASMLSDTTALVSPPSPNPMTTAMTAVSVPSGGNGASAELSSSNEKIELHREHVSNQAGVSQDDSGNGSATSDSSKASLDRDQSAGDDKSSVRAEHNQEQRWHHHHQQQPQNLNSTQDNNNQQQRMYHNPVQHQPDGWRVKLYRLNVDGSWDDCGTGRIVCLYRSTLKHQQHPNANKLSTSIGGLEGASTDVDKWLYQETGEATLCVHAEVQTNTSNGNTDDSKQDGTRQHQHPPQVLLRTRILLRDAYQRQGDNIITWCEPYFSSPQHRHNDSSLHHHAKNKTSNKNNKSSGGVDLALSFQDNAGCLDIWRQITQVQGRAAALLRQHQHHQQQQHRIENGGSATDTSVEDMAAQAAAQHHANLQQEHEKNLMWNRQQLQQQPQHNHLLQGNMMVDNDMMRGMMVSDGNHHDDSNIAYGIDLDSNSNGNDSNAQHPSHSQQQQQQGMVLQQQLQLRQQWQLPHSPTLDNLAEVGDVIASFQHVAQHRETLVSWIIADDCMYMKQLLKLFPAAEERGDYSKLATLAACVKCILLLNDPSILEWIVNESSIFEQVCSCLEYDPDLREKANHRWFIRERAKFRTVVPMDDPTLISLIHRSFRVTYLRDTLLRPTMDESSLSTLSSLQTFTHNDVVKCVATTPGIMDNTQLHDDNNSSNVENNSNHNSEFTDMLKGSYMLRVIRMLGVEIHALTSLEWNEMETYLMAESNNQQQEGSATKETATLSERRNNRSSDDLGGGFRSTGGIGEGIGSSKIETDPSIVIHNKEEPHNSTTWKQYLAPQDPSIESRRLRRRGCLSFLRELFNMVRISLQQCDKDDFFSSVCQMEIDLLPSYHDHSSHAGGGGSGNMDEYFREISDNVSQTSQTVEVGSVASTVRSSEYRYDVNEKSPAIEQVSGATCIDASNALSAVTANGTASMPSPTTLLALLSNLLADPRIDVSERVSVLEIVAIIAMQDPSLIRHHCIDVHRSWKKDMHQVFNGGGESKLHTNRPVPNENKQVIFFCPPDDLLAAMLFVMDVEADAGVLLQVSEIMRIILDTDMVGDHCGSGPMSPSATSVGGSGCSFDEDDDGYPSEKQVNDVQQHDQQVHLHHPTQHRANEQKQFLSMFYDRYVEWLVAPFQFTLVYPACRVPSNILSNPSDSPIMQKYMPAFQKGVVPNDDPFLKTVSACAIRSSFTVELLSFCVRAHLYRMKFFLLKSRILGSVLNVLRAKPRMYAGHGAIPGDRCLKLAALRFLRAILSVKDEFYHRHIIKHDLFEPVFDAFRANPVGDNLVSSAIVEICDFIHNEKIMSLLEHIVTKHLMAYDPKGIIPSLEDVSSPYVSTLTTLRKAYEACLNTGNSEMRNEGNNLINGSRENNIDAGPFPSRNLEDESKERYQFQLNPHSQRQLTGKAFEDQRKFREVDEEESYFDSDDDIPATDAEAGISYVGAPNHTIHNVAGSRNSPLATIPPAVDKADQGEDS